MNGDVVNGDLPKLPPPAKLKKEIRQRGKLVLETLWILVLLVPTILLVLYRKVYPSLGKPLHGKVVLVSGAGRGLGRGLAIAFAKQGCKVACVDVDKHTVAETADIINLSGNEAGAYITNVGKPQDVLKLATDVTKDLGPVDILVNNAALMSSHYFGEAQDHEILGIMQVNLLSHFWMIRAFLPSMQERNTGHIVAISSISAFTGLGLATSYSSAKWGVTGLMDSLREELRSNPGNDIHVSVVHPYYINTSAEYTNRWELRIPELTIEEVVESTIEAVRQNQFMVTIPEHMYYVIHLVKFFPQQIIDLFKDIVYSKLKPPSREEWIAFPQPSIIADTVGAK